METETINNLIDTEFKKIESIDKTPNSNLIVKTVLKREFLEKIEKQKGIDLNIEVVIKTRKI